MIAFILVRIGQRELADGGQGIDPTYRCLSPGMPRIMNNYEGAEFVVTPVTKPEVIAACQRVDKPIASGAKPAATAATATPAAPATAPATAADAPAAIVFGPVPRSTRGAGPD